MKLWHSTLSDNKYHIFIYVEALNLSSEIIFNEFKEALNSLNLDVQDVRNLSQDEYAEYIEISSLNSVNFSPLF